MKTYHHNGEFWYADLTPLWLRVLRWFIWIGGWEKAIWTRAGYSHRWEARHALRLALRARGHRSRRWAVFHSMCPLGFFGHRITFQSFGCTISTRRGYLCIEWPPHTSPGAEGWRVYWSTNATPSSATHWWRGAPPEARRAAALLANARADKEERWQAERAQRALRAHQ